MPVKGPAPKITIEQMAWVFEQLDEDVPLKSLAIDLNVHVSTLSRRIARAEKEGFAAFKQEKKKC